MKLESPNALRQTPKNFELNEFEIISRRERAGTQCFSMKQKNRFQNQNSPSAKEQRIFLDTTAGTISESQFNWLKENVREDAPLYAEAQIATGPHGSFANAQTISDEALRGIKKNQIELSSRQDSLHREKNAEEAIREVSMDISNMRIKEMSSNPDLQAMESVQALDEVDKTANIIQLEAARMVRPSLSRAHVDG